MNPSRQLLTWAVVACALTFGCYEDNETEPTDGGADALPACADGEEQSCFVDGSDTCLGSQTCSGGAFGACDAPVEICDGIDNDCDGTTDEGFGSIGEACEDGEGACADTGTVVCAADGSSAVCNAQPGDGGDELCDGVDNDCDGATDEETGGGECATGLPGECGAGTLTCADGDSACEPTTEATDEVCDGLDNDCDGNIDEGPNGGPLAVPCYEGDEGTEGVGQCAAGVQVCTDGALGECAEQALPGVEICDGIDNDCNGETDDADVDCVCEPGAIQGCYTGPEGTEGVGACTAGVQACAEDGTAWGPCESEVVPGVELCDGIDNSCDGEVDNAPGVGEACSAGTGACAVDGTRTCDIGTGQVVCDAEAGLPGDEICDGIDNDCNGLVDDVEGAGEVCRVGDGACASVGVTACTEGGEVVCIADADAPAIELCNGIDDDCNGVVDDVEGLGEDCEAGLGACLSTGFTVCGDGEIICGAVPQEPRPEICDNGIDEDCTGEADDAFECLVECIDDAGCGDGELCIDNACVAGDCRDDAECLEEGELCIDNTCRPANCRGDDECAEGEICADFTCTPVPQACVETPSIDDFGRRTGTTVGEPSEIGASCAGGAQEPERAWRLALDYTGPVCVTTDGSRYDTALYVQSRCGDPASEIACDDDGGEGTRSQIELDYTAGEDVYVFVDGFGTGDGGPFILDVLEGPCTCRDDDSCAEGESCVLGACVPTECGNGMIEGAEVCDDGNADAGDGCSDLCEVEFGFTCEDGDGDCAADQSFSGFVFGDGARLPPSGGEGGEPFLDACDPGEVIEGLDLNIGEEWAGEGNGAFVQQVRARCATVNEEGGRVHLQSGGNTDGRGSAGGEGTFNETLTCPLGMVMTGYVGYTAERPDRPGQPYLSGLAAVCARISLADGGLVIGDALTTEAVGRTDDEVGRFDCPEGSVVSAQAGGAAIIVDSFTVQCAPIVDQCAQPSACEQIGDCIDDEGCAEGELCVDFNCRPGDCREQADCAEGEICDDFTCVETPEEGAVRLADGETPDSGRVEIFVQGQWGTVCDDNFGDEDADVVCRQLGYPGAIRNIQQFGGGVDPIWLDEVACVGDEERLLDCPANELGDNNCGHSEDVGVECALPCDIDDDCPEGQRCGEGICFDPGPCIEEEFEAGEGEPQTLEPGLYSGSLCLEDPTGEDAVFVELCDGGTLQANLNYDPIQGELGILMGFFDEEEPRVQELAVDGAASGLIVNDLGGPTSGVVVVIGDPAVYDLELIVEGCDPDPEICDDNVGNDGDDATDCLDDDCFEHPSCQFEPAPPGGEPLPIAAPGHRVGFEGSVDEGGPQWARPSANCTPTDGVDHLFQAFPIVNTTGAAQQVRVTTSTPDGDGYVHVFGEPFDPAVLDNCIAGDDDFGNTTASQVVDVPIADGEVQWIVVSTFGANAAIGAFTVEVLTEADEICDDGLDNDDDTAVDCADADCAADPACVVIDPEICDDAADNDGDGDIDCDDADCDGDPACADVCVEEAFETGEGEPAIIPPGVYAGFNLCPDDNTGRDGFLVELCDGGTLTVDFTYDPARGDLGVQMGFIDEPGPRVVAEGVDGAGSGTLVNDRGADLPAAFVIGGDPNGYDIEVTVEGCDDPPEPEICDDAADNDGDGDIDCADEDCAADPACVVAECPVDMEPNGDIENANRVMPGTYDCGLLDGGDEDFTGVEVCGGGVLTATLSGFEGDLDIFLYAADGTELDRGFTLNPIETATTTPEVAGPIFIRVDGAGAAAGAYTLDIAVDGCEPIDGDLRIIDGAGENTGRLEVFFEGQWGTICNDHWGDFRAPPGQDLVNGDVACQQLGYPGVAEVFDAPPGQDPTWLDNVECLGGEARLADCPAAEVGVENCNHDEDVGITCLLEGECRIDAHCADGEACTDGTCGPLPAPEICDDAADNDGDGDIDCADADCVDDPACVVPDPELCDDAVDNDGDGDIDCADADCVDDPACVVAVEICDDGFGNDGDDLTDCYDDDCIGHPTCVFPPVPLGGEPLPIAGPGHLVAYEGALDGDDPQWDRPNVECTPSGPADHYYAAFPIVNTTGAPQQVLVTAAWGAVDGYLFAFGDPFVPDNLDNCIVGGDDFNGTGGSQLTDVALADGEVIWIIASTFAPNVTIDAFTIQVLTEPDEVCNDGLDNDDDTAVDCDDADCAADPACLPPEPEVCDSGLDEDQDGDIDCADADCVDDPACAVAACPDAEDGFEPNDDLDGAVPIAEGLTEGLARCGNDDFYVIEVCVGGTITVDALFLHADGDLDIELLDDGGARLGLSQSSNDDEQASTTNNGADPVNVYVRAYFRDNPDYDLNIVIEGCLVARSPGPGDLIITEYFNNPAGADGVREWFEVQNVSADLIQVQGMTVRDDGGDNHLVDTDYTIAPGAYAVFGESRDRAQNGDVDVHVLYSGTLANGDDEIVLEFEGVEIDAVRYDDGAGWPDPNGNSNALSGHLTPDVDNNDDPANWCLQDPPSPGAANGACPIDIAGPGAAVAFSGSIDDTDPTWARAVDNCGNFTGTTAYYDAWTIVNTTGAEQAINVDVAFGDDGYLHVFTSPFVPDVIGGCIVGNDDGPGGRQTSQLNDVVIADGESLTIVVSTFSPRAAIGPYNVTVLTQQAAADPALAACEESCDDVAACFPFIPPDPTCVDQCMANRENQAAGQCIADALDPGAGQCDLNALLACGGGIAP